ncbi:MAG TPA: HlyD family secretion protein [Stellaceae bacterium]|jgi:membrane fusion protein (multidrug efflux system)
MYAEQETRDEKSEAPTTKSRWPQDEAAPPPPRQDDQPPSPRRVWLRRGLYLLLPLALLVGLIWYVRGGKVMTTDDAYVNADKVGVSTDVSGLVKEVDVAENEQVQAGQVLYRLDPLPFQLALERADAQLGNVANELNALKANYSDTQAQIAQAQTDADYYGTEYNRQQNLFKSHVTSEAAVDTAQRNLVNARQKLDSVMHQLAGVAANLSGDPGRPIEQQPRYRDTLAQRDEAQREFDHSVVKAPFAGTVTNVSTIAPGKYLQASATAFYLVATNTVWVDAQPKETELTWVHPGQPAIITVDTYPNTQWRGTVESVSPAAAQEFSLLPPQNTSGNWVKVVQRVPMRVRVDVSDRRLPLLRAGMSAEVAIDTGHARGWPHFLTALFGGSSSAGAAS